MNPSHNNERFVGTISNRRQYIITRERTPGLLQSGTCCYVLDEYFESSKGEISVPKLVDDLATQVREKICTELDAITHRFVVAHSARGLGSDIEFYSLISVSRLNWNGKSNFNHLVKLLAVELHSGARAAWIDDWANGNSTSHKNAKSTFLRSRTGALGLKNAIESVVWLLWRAISHLSLRQIGEFSRNSKSLIVSYPEDEIAQSAGSWSRFWGDLPTETSTNELDVNWLFLPDHGYSMTGLRKAMRRTPASQEFNHFIHADALTGFSVLARIFATYVKNLPVRLQTFRAVERELKHEIGFRVLRSALLDSWAGRPYLESLYFQALFEKLGLHKPARALYLFENQTWEKNLNSFSKHETLETIGVSHSTTRFWDLRLTLDSALNPETYLPSALVANSGASKLDLQMLTSALKIPIETSKALRYSYLSRRTKRYTAREPRKILVCFGYSKTVTARLLKEVLSIGDPSLTIRLRFHPGVSRPKRIFKIPPQGLELSEANLESDLAWCDAVITDSMSSVSFEAMHEGIPTLLFRDGTTPNMSPLFHKAAIPTFWDHNSLKDALKSGENFTLDESLRFILQDNQNQWVSILKSDFPL
jgi:surface carbohydrate biosynthesis protein (TIGR04326 family)